MVNTDENRDMWSTKQLPEDIRQLRLRHHALSHEDLKSMFIGINRKKLRDLWMASKVEMLCPGSDKYVWDTVATLDRLGFRRRKV